MPDYTPADVQWFIYALADNGAMSAADGFQLYHSLSEGSGLGEYAQSVLDRLAQDADENDAAELVEQIQALADYAVEQAESGEVPDFSGELEDAVEYEAAPAAPEIDEAALIAGAVRDQSALHFDAFDVDLSAINSYSDLPSFSDTPYLTDEQLAERMIYMLSCLRHLGCS
ncbi:MAG: hypothetical protein J6Q80_01305, partial [Lentisphaeria bacterium]|nr:hypothetical protein [Lentisphaeria bacterium]